VGGFGDEPGTPTTSERPARHESKSAISDATAEREGNATAIGCEVTRRGFEVEIVLTDGRIFDDTLDKDFELVRQPQIPRRQVKITGAPSGSASPRSLRRGVKCWTVERAATRSITSWHGPE
jgi:hypothetical protein